MPSVALEDHDQLERSGAMRRSGLAGYLALNRPRRESWLTIQRIMPGDF